MRTVAEVIEEQVAAAPFLEDALALGILNLSALARRLRPRVEEALHKEVSDAAVMMALKRLEPRFAGKSAAVIRVLRRMGELTVRSNLVEFTFRNSETILERQRELLAAIHRRSDTFLTVTQGVLEVTIIASATFTRRIEEVFASERTVSRLDNLSAINIRLPKETVQTPGVHYVLLKQLAFADINVVEVVSTFTELTVVLSHQEVDRAFSVLKRFLWP
jgi:hypothetical protein